MGEIEFCGVLHEVLEQPHSRSFTGSSRVAYSFELVQDIKDKYPMRWPEHGRLQLHIYTLGVFCIFFPKFN